MVYALVGECWTSVWYHVSSDRLSPVNPAVLTDFKQLSLSLTEYCAIFASLDDIDDNGKLDHATLLHTLV